MSADVAATAHPSAEAKGARKKKAKAEATTTLEQPRRDSQATSDAGAPKLNGVDGVQENQYIRELQKQIRNLNKKLNGTTKVEQIMKEFPDLSLDDLVVTKKINADQKAQATKIPGMKAQLAQLEEQLATYRQIDKEYAEHHAREKELLRSAHADELQQLREVVVAEQKLVAQKQFRMHLLTLSRYLSAAARRRNNMTEGEEETEETKAFEGLLSQVYGASPDAVYAAEKLIEGVDAPVVSQDGTPTSITYATVKKLSLEECPLDTEDPFPDTSAPQSRTLEEPTSDPTTAHAGLTELNDATTGAAEADAQSPTATAAPTSAGIGADASNQAGNEQWDASQAGGADSSPLAESYEIIPRPAEETETREQPSAPAASQSWADEPIEVTTGADATPGAVAQANGVGNDGFHEVHHHGRGRGGFRGGDGRGRGWGEFRGRGRGRGEFRGRGRGGPRGERGGFRGGPRGGGAPAAPPAASNGQ